VKRPVTAVHMVQQCSIEYLPNIRQLVVIIPIKESPLANNSDLPANRTTKLFLNRTTKCIHSHEEEQTCSADLLISIPGALGIDRLALPIDGESIENYPQISRIDDVLILQFRNVSVSGVQGSLPNLPSAKEVQEHCCRISCSACEEDLIYVAEPGFTFKDLPNEHWLELLDCWSCHDNEFAPIAERALNHCATQTTSCHDHSHAKKSYDQLNNESSGLILPPVGKIYLGTAHILANSNDFSLLSCPVCLCPVSESVSGGAAVKIYRDSILFNSHGKAFDFPKETFNGLLMRRILDTIDNHSTFHFYLKSPTRTIYMKALNWNVQVFDFGSKTWQIAFKLGYSLDHTGCAFPDAEVISCTDGQFDLVLDCLQRCHHGKLFGSSLKFPGTDSLKMTYLTL
jgi:hypothetical protein